MAAPLDGDDDDLFNKLKRADPKVLEERQNAVNERVHATFEKSHTKGIDYVMTYSSSQSIATAHTLSGRRSERFRYKHRSSADSVCELLLT